MFFNENQFDGNKQACGQIMTQHGDSNRWISDDQSYSLPSDTDFLDPRAVIDRGEQDETARSYTNSISLLYVSQPSDLAATSLVSSGLSPTSASRDDSTSSKLLLLSNLRRTPLKGISRGLEPFKVENS